MSKAYTSDGKRRSSQTHANRAYTCVCGKVTHGNGGRSSHQRACPAYIARYGCPACKSIRMEFHYQLDDWRCKDCGTWRRDSERVSSR